MADLAKIVKYLNLFLGYVTVAFGVYLTVTVVLMIMTTKFDFRWIPACMMPVFFVLIGVMVLSYHYEFRVIRKNCAFLNDKCGVLCFYTYLGTLMGYYHNYLANNPELQFVCICMGVGYGVLAILLGALGMCGEKFVNEQTAKLTAKIVNDE